MAHQATIIFGGENMATLAPCKTRKLEARNRKKAMCKAKVARDSKYAKWVNQNPESWTIERKLVNGHASQAEIDELLAEVGELHKAIHHKLPQLKEAHQAAKRRASKAKGDLTKAEKRLEREDKSKAKLEGGIAKAKKKIEAAEASKDAEAIKEATDELNGAEKAFGDIFNELENTFKAAEISLSQKESEVRTSATELKTLADDLHNSKTRRRIAWLEKWVPACSIMREAANKSGAGKKGDS